MTLHIYDDLIQGEEEWLAVRRGMLTASVVGQLITEGPPDVAMVHCPTCGADVGPCMSINRKVPVVLKGVHDARTRAAGELPPVLLTAATDKSRSLALTLAAERIVDWTDPVFETWDMLRGKEDEPLAVNEYERRTGNTVKHVGFITNTIRGHVVGFSPDGLVDDVGAIECKSRKGKKQLATMLADEVPAENLAQIQMGLMVSERDWCDYVSYAGGWPAYITRVTPDDRWQSAIADAVERFEETVDRMVTDWHNRYGALPRTERTPDYDAPVELKL